MPKCPLPPLHVLRKYFSYNPETGDLLRRERSPEDFGPPSPTRAYTTNMWNGHFANKIAGSINRHGYRTVTFMGKYILAHRIAYALHGGGDPECIDHINRVRSDNRFVNLRAISSIENNLNKKLFANNTSGVPNVRWHRDKRKWTVQVHREGYGWYCAAFSDFGEAAVAAIQKRKEMGFLSTTVRDDRVAEVRLALAKNIGGDRG